MLKPIKGHGEYTFTETETDHGDRLGSFRRARMLRRAILEKLNNVKYSDVTEILRNASLEDLMGEAAVTLEHDGRLTPISVSSIVYPGNFARKFFAGSDQAEGEKTRTVVSFDGWMTANPVMADRKINLNS